MSFFARSDEQPGWVAEVPENWRSDWLKWSVSLSTEKPSEAEQETLPYISNEDVASWTGRLLKDNPQPAESDGRKFQIDDVLLNKLRPYLAKVYHAEFDGVSSGELLCLRPSADVLPRFLFYVLASKGFIDTIDAETFGSKMPRADWEIVGHQPLPLPLLEIQQRIARFLDERTARIDGLIEKKRALLERLAEKRQALITRAITKGLNPDAPMKPSGIDWLGDIPAHWEVKPIYSFQKRITYGFTNPMPTTDEGPYMLTANDIGHGAIRYETARHTDQDAFENDITDKSRPEAGDVLITKDGTLGRVAVFVGQPACINQSVALLRVLQNIIEPDFLAYCLLSEPYQEEMLLNAGGTTIKHIYITRLTKMPVAMPQLSEQNEIRAYCDRVSSYISDSEQGVRRSVSALLEYRASMIVSAVTGQIAELQ